MLSSAAMVFGAILAFANGANDNFKGVSTIYGSKLASFRSSLVWATLTTFAGSALAFFLAGDLLKSFSGKGIVSDEVFTNPAFPLSVALAAAVTVFIASRFGLPISTTHALTGALFGADIMGAAGVNFSRLGALFLFPLLLSPLAAVALTVAALWLQKRLQRKSASETSACLCVTPGVTAEVNSASVMQASISVMPLPQIIIGNTSDTACADSAVQVSRRSLTQLLHLFGAGLVSFARGLNDTPKIAAIMLASSGLAQHHALVGVGLFIAVGGWIYSRRVAETLAHKITPMTENEGLTANMITAALVVGASRFGLPVSTTHVSTGAIFGIGAMSGKMRWKTFQSIAAAWLTTMPLAALISALSFSILRRFIS